MMLQEKLHLMGWGACPQPAAIFGWSSETSTKCILILLPHVIKTQNLLQDKKGNSNAKWMISAAAQFHLQCEKCLKLYLRIIVWYFLHHFSILFNPLKLLMPKNPQDGVSGLFFWV